VTAPSNDWKVNLIRLPLAQDPMVRSNDESNGPAAWLIATSWTSWMRRVRQGTFTLILDFALVGLRQVVNEGGRSPSTGFAGYKKIQSRSWQDMANANKNQPNVISVYTTRPAADRVLLPFWRDGGRRGETGRQECPAGKSHLRRFAKAQRHSSARPAQQRRDGRGLGWG